MHAAPLPPRPHSHQPHASVIALPTLCFFLPCPAARAGPPGYYYWLPGHFCCHQRRRPVSPGPRGSPLQAACARQPVCNAAARGSTQLPPCMHAAQLCSEQGIHAGRNIPRRRLLFALPCSGVVSRMGADPTQAIFGECFTSALPVWSCVDASSAHHMRAPAVYRSAGAKMPAGASTCLELQYTTPHALIPTPCPQPKPLLQECWARTGARVCWRAASTCPSPTTPSWT